MKSTKICQINLLGGKKALQFGAFVPVTNFIYVHGQTVHNLHQKLKLQMPQMLLHGLS